MRVLMYGWEFPPFNSGGLGVACYGLSQGLLAHGADITFVLPRTMDVAFDGLQFRFADHEKITFHTVDSLLYPYLGLYEYTEMLARYKRAQYGNTLIDEVFRYAQAAKEIARHEPHDIIHAHDWLSFPAGIEAKKVSRKPLIAHVHATEFDRSGGHGVNKAVYEIEKEGMKKADYVVAVSHYTKKIIVSKYDIDPQKVVVVHNGIEHHKYQTYSIDDLLTFKSLGRPIVLFTGRLTMQKGPDYFMHAAQRVLRYEPHTMFVIAGAGDMENQIVNLSIELGIAGNVLFAGFLRGDELNKLYQSADLMVMPSISEPFGITALEALANRTPVLVSRQSGVSEILSHVLKTDFWDVDEIAHKIVAVIRYQSLREALRVNGRKEVEHWSWNRAAEKILSLYHQLHARGHHAHVNH